MSIFFFPIVVVLSQECIKFLCAYFHHQCSVAVNEKMRFIKNWEWEVEQEVTISSNL